MAILVSLLGVVNLGCFIMVLINLFRAEGVLKGILGIICAIYAFIWGWIHANEYENMRTVMIVWTATIVLVTVVSSFTAASGY